MHKNATPDVVTKNRALVQAVILAGKKLGIKTELLEHDWLIRLTKGNHSHLVYAYSFDCNTHAAASIAGDKVMTYRLLDEANLQAVPHFLLNSLVNPSIELKELSRLYAEHAELVIKPVRGSRGEYITKTSSPGAAVQHTNISHPQFWAASPFIDIDYELRVVVLAGEVKLAYRKYDAPVIDGLKMFNLRLGAKVEGIAIASLDEAVKTLAIKAMWAIGLNLGAVDIVFKQDGTMAVLEINGGFSLEHYASISDENRNEVINFYETVVEKMFLGQV